MEDDQLSQDGRQARQLGMSVSAGLRLSDADHSLGTRTERLRIPGICTGPRDRELEGMSVTMRVGTRRAGSHLHLAWLVKMSVLFPALQPSGQ